jgi:hypothetical protein
MHGVIIMKQALKQYGVYCAARMAFNKGISLQDALIGFFGVNGLRNYKGE